MFSPSERRPAPVLVILMILGIIILMVFTRGEGSKEWGVQEITVTGSTFADTQPAPGSIPVTPAVQQTLAQVQAETQIREQRATQTAIAEQQAQAATATVVQVTAVVRAAATAQQLEREMHSAQIEQERLLAMAAVILAAGLAVTLILLALGLIIQVSLEARRKVHEAALAQAEQERLLTEARRRLVEARPRRTAPMVKPLDSKCEPLPPNGKAQDKDWAKKTELDERINKLPMAG